MSLELSQESHHQATTNPADPHEVKPIAKRPSMTIEADSKITAAWKVTYIAKPMANDVLVHFYIVKIARSGQAPPAAGAAGGLAGNGTEYGFCERNEHRSKIGCSTDRGGDLPGSTGGAGDG